MVKAIPSPDYNADAALLGLLGLRARGARRVVTPG